MSQSSRLREPGDATHRVELDRGSQAVGARYRRMTELVEENRDEDGRHPDQDEKQIVLSRPQECDDQEEQRMD